MDFPPDFDEFGLIGIMTLCLIYAGIFSAIMRKLRNRDNSITLRNSVEAFFCSCLIFAVVGFVFIIAYIFVFVVGNA